MASDALYLVMDMINDLVHEDGPSKNSYGPELARRGTIAKTQTVLAKARAAGIRIGYVRIGFSPDYRECPPASKVFTSAKTAGMFKLGTWGTEVHEALAPQPGDFDIVKHRVSPFYSTNLDVLIHANGIKRLFLSGVSTSGAVLSCAKDGHDRDLAVTVVEDCCCHVDQDVHDAIIESMKRMCEITTSDEVSFT